MTTRIGPPLVMAAFLALLAVGRGGALTPIDHTGVYRSQIGGVAIVLGRGEAIVSYSAVFGASAHICDWIAQGREQNDGSYAFKDNSGVIMLKRTVAGMTLEPTEGVPTYCGTGWPGDRFGYPPDSHGQVQTVRVERAYFFTAAPTPVRRKAYVVNGDHVLTLPCQHSDGKDFVLARFSGPEGATIGLLRKADLAPPD
jgi:hypothetical protein